MLYEKIDFLKDAGYAAKVPEFISNSINPKMKPREYQINAIENFITYFENDKLLKKPTHTLFHMATGSGKTLIMASLMIYLYSRGYRNFIFFVNSLNIIKKTKENFLNPLSPKYLFNNDIEIGGNKIKINEVMNFQGASEDSLNICFVSIQGLHMDLWNIKENSLTFNDFEDRKVVLLSDEAHHINVETRSNRITASEINIRNNWETTVSRIFRSCEDNVLLDFTATMDYANDQNLMSKYIDKIIYDYPLKKFRIDGYSKEIKTMRTDASLIDRALIAILMSQYRLKVFEEHGIRAKPVILFKSKTIPSSQENMVTVIDAVKRLTLQDLLRLKKYSDENTLGKMFNYFEQRELFAEDLIYEIQNDFHESKFLSVNDESQALEYQILVNTLENADNHYRAIFEVKKLDEGWDVLNLFDIVRLYETRDSRDGKPGKTTTQEAQLIGRGARYFPFKITSDQEKHTRKFDSDIENPLRICEELYFHCQENPRYINELRTALIETGILPEKSIEIEYKVKSSIKESAFYKYGKVFHNDRIKIDLSDYNVVSSGIGSRIYKYTALMNRAKVDNLLESNEEIMQMKHDKFTSIFTIREIAEASYSLMHKAIRSQTTFRFEKIRSIFPKVQSIREFILNENYLGGIRIEIDHFIRTLDNLTLYEACKKTVGEIADEIDKLRTSYKGTLEFKSINLSEVFQDKRVKVSDPSGYGFGISQYDVNVPNHLRFDLSSEDWYMYNDNFGTSQEKEFVKYFSRRIDEFRSNFKHIMLVRNERDLPIYSFKDGQRFEPDYLLFLCKEFESNIEYYQIFIEPKGEHLIETEKWKEKFLLDLESQSEIIKVFANDDEYKIIGLHFFNTELRMNEFDKDISMILNR